MDNEESKKIEEVMTEGEISDSDAESAAGGGQLIEIADYKIPFACNNKGCSEYGRQSMFYSSVKPICYRCRQPLVKYSDGGFPVPEPHKFREPPKPRR